MEKLTNDGRLIIAIKNTITKSIITKRIYSGFSFVDLFEGYSDNLNTVLDFQDYEELTTATIKILSDKEVIDFVKNLGFEMHIIEYLGVHFQEIKNN